MKHLIFTVVISSLFSLPISLGVRPSKNSTPTNHAQDSILIWKVGSRYIGEIPDITIPSDLLKAAHEAGLQLQIEAYPAAGIAQRFFDAVSYKTEPDILATNDYGIIEEIKTSSGNSSGIEPSKTVRRLLIQVSESFRSLESQFRGWEFLVSSSRNHDKARLLAMRNPVCIDDISSHKPGLSSDELLSVKEMAVSAARAYLTCDAGSIAELSDGSRLGTGCRFPQKGAEVDKVYVCNVFGNRELAFIFMLANFELVNSTLTPTNIIGHKSIMAVLRRNEDSWRLLTITDDPVSNNIERLGPDMRKLSNLIVDENVDPPTPAILITEDRVAFSYAKERRYMDFEWIPSSSSNVIAEVAEFEYQQATRLFFLFGNPGRVSSGKLWTTRSLWHWRVWSICKNGKITLSENRSFDH